MGILYTKARGLLFRPLKRTRMTKMVVSRTQRPQMGKIANRVNRHVFSDRCQLAQAIPQFHVEWTLHEWTPIARSESRHNDGRVCED